MATIETLNQIKAIPEDTPVINVNMANAIYRGPIGPVGPVGAPGPQGERGFKGDKGDTGASGVYIGAQEPTDNTVMVWIDTAGEGNTLPASEEAKF